RPATRKPAAPPKSAATRPTRPKPAAAAAGAPPLPNYDELSVASLRARLRGLTAEQVRGLIGYERAHAARPDVISMFERRLDKLAGD
ncbi:MAG: hypothetical protein J2P35_24170, partial [Actinobacteria bacterium]|nr:hypothetical protein [Actinomycetota bacterium]